MKKIIFICLGNICRSPIAQAMMRKTVDDKNLKDQYFIDSAGTGSWHIGRGNDPRMIETGERHQLKMNHLAQQLQPKHGDEFDYLFAMDEQNYNDILKVVDKKNHKKVFLFRKFDNVCEDINVPDPYYGKDDGFENVYRIVQRNCKIIFSLIEKNQL